MSFYPYLDADQAKERHQELLQEAEIERRLRRLGLIKPNLLERTLQQISSLLASSGKRLRAQARSYSTKPLARPH